MTIGVPLTGLARVENMSQENKAAKLPSKGNPFEVFNNWNEETFNEVEVVIGTINETTSDFTKKKNPKNRYWRAPVTFKIRDHESEVLKQTNIEVPYNKGQTYGQDYMYVAMPKFVGKHIEEAAAKQGIAVQVDDERLNSTDTKWWKTLNNCADNCGIITKDGQFQQRDISNAFRSSKQGIIVNVDYCVSLRLTKTTTDDRNDQDVFRDVLDCSRVALKHVRVDVEGPPLTARVPTTKAIKDDVATDELMQQLESLGI